MHVLFPLTVLTVCIGATYGLGAVHTSLASVAALVETENLLIHSLQDYVDKEEGRLHEIKKYIVSWDPEQTNYIHNPLNSYHFLRRLTHDFNTLQNNLHEDHTRAIRANLTSLRESVEVPVEADVNGAAFAIVRLQETFGLEIDDLVEGKIKDKQAVSALSADDCFRLGQQSFNNLEFELAERWYNKGLALLESFQPIPYANQKKIEKIKKTQKQRTMMQNMVTHLAQSSDENVLDQFSGLGIPTSFQKKIYSGKKEFTQIDGLDDLYRRLCRGEKIQPAEAYIGMKCGYVFGNTGYRKIMPFKAELIWAEPVVVIYHEVLSDSEADLLKALTQHNLVTTKVHSFTTHQPRESLARIGKTAWVTLNQTAEVARVMRRIEDMTGLTTKTAEELHVLNYGIGGHYDAHVDFFDLQMKKLDKDPHLGDRIATALFYLNDVEAGGSTVFPTLGLEIPARKGNALFWFNLKRNGEGDYRTVHASCPVLLGEKWIANLWLHEYGQEFKWPCTLNKNE